MRRTSTYSVGHLTEVQFSKLKALYNRRSSDSRSSNAPEKRYIAISSRRKASMSEDLVSKDLQAELTEMMGPVSWELLKPHVQRDAVIVVNSQLDLVEVGAAIASDQTQAVERWINEQLIQKPTAAQLVSWNGENKSFTSLIVQPYVLIQAQSITAADSFDSLPDASSG